MEASRREHGMALCCLVPTDKSATRIVLQIVLGHGRSRIYRVEKRNSVLTQVVACVRKPRAAWQSRLMVSVLSSQLSKCRTRDEVKRIWRHHASLVSDHIEFQVYWEIRTSRGGAKAQPVDIRPFKEAPPSLFWARGCATVSHQFRAATTINR